MTNYHTLTDEQYEAYCLLRSKCERLQRDLIESRKATESVQVHAEEVRQGLHALISVREDTIADLVKVNNDRLTAVRHNAGALVETLSALRRLLAALDQCEVFGNDGKALEVLKKISDEARAAVRKYDIPF